MVKLFPATVIGYDGDTGWDCAGPHTSPSRASCTGDSTQLKVGSQLKVVSRKLILCFRK